jgi:transitional endoplasmic reticulum ATPase
VEEAHNDDQGRAMARICPSFLRDCGISVGDLIELQSRRKKAIKVGAIVIPCKKNDRGIVIVRIDCDIRRNLGVTLGELVTIRRVERQQANRITVAPAEVRIRLLVRPELLRKALLKRPIVRREVLAIKGKIRKILPKEFQKEILSSAQMGLVKIKVVRTDPQGIVVVGEDTEINVQEEFDKPAEVVRQEQPPQHWYSRATEYN